LMLQRYSDPRTAYFPGYIVAGGRYMRLVSPAGRLRLQMHLSWYSGQDPRSGARS
jgi:hypothetical protein